MEDNLVVAARLLNDMDARILTRYAAGENAADVAINLEMSTRDVIKVIREKGHDNRNYSLNVVAKRRDLSGIVMASRPAPRLAPPAPPTPAAVKPKRRPQTAPPKPADPAPAPAPVDVAVEQALSDLGFRAADLDLDFEIVDAPEPDPQPAPPKDDVATSTAPAAGSYAHRADPSGIGWDGVAEHMPDDQDVFSETVEQATEAPNPQEAPAGVPERVPDDFFHVMTAALAAGNHELTGRAESIIREIAELRTLIEQEARAVELRQQINVLDQEIAEREQRRSELRAELETLLAGGATVRVVGQPRRSAEPDTSDVRAWAVQNGFEVKPVGKLPNGVVEAYKRAHKKAAA